MNERDSAVSFLLFFAIAVVLVLYFGLQNLGKEYDKYVQEQQSIKKSFEDACAKVGGKPVFNGKNMECLK